MPPFLYHDVVNPYVASIDDLLLRSGDIAARRARAVGDANARAAEIAGQAQARADEQRGEIWGKAAQQVGQTVAAIPQQIQQQKQQAQESELNTIKLDDVKRQQRSRNIFEQELKNPGNYKPDGTIDDAKVTARLQQQDVGAYQQWAAISATNQKNALDFREKAAQIAKTEVDTTEKQRQLVLAQHEYLGRLADQGLGILQQNAADPQHGRDLFLALTARAAADGAVSPAEAQQFYESLKNAPPEKLGEILNAAIAPEVRVKIDKEKADLAHTQAETTSLLHPKPPAPPASVQEYEYAKTQGYTGTYEQYQNDDANRHRSVTNITTGPNASIPGNWDANGDEFLKSIPAQWRATVKKIAQYDEDPTKVASMRGGMRETLMQWVNQVNPAYDQSSFAIRNPTRKAFTTGTQGQQITAMNTAIEHLDQLQAAADALANGTFKPGNAAYNYLRDTFGSAMPSNYDTIKNMVDKEVEAVANKGVPTVSGTAEQKALASTAASPAAIKGYVDTLIPLMGSKLNALHYQYTQAMGADDPWKPLTPQAEAILQKRGVRAGGVTSNTPDREGWTTVNGIRIREKK